MEKEWEFDRIFLSTEDADVCLRMKEAYGDRISFTDQERYRVRPGQVLVQLHQEKKPGGGVSVYPQPSVPVQKPDRFRGMLRADGSAAGK